MHILLTYGFPAVSPQKGYMAMRAFTATAQSPSLGWGLKLISTVAIVLTMYFLSLSDMDCYSFRLFSVAAQNIGTTNNAVDCNGPTQTSVEQVHMRLYTNLKGIDSSISALTDVLPCLALSGKDVL